MRSQTPGFLLIAFALAPSAAALAQTPGPVSVGERVRITMPDRRGRHRLVGRIADVQHDTLVLDSDDIGTAARVPLSQATRIEVSGGRHTNVRRGMGIGMVGGAVAGALIGATTYHKGRAPACSLSEVLLCWGSPVDPGEAPRGISPRAGATIYGLLGILAGGIGGAIIHTERWSARPLGVAARLGTAPSGGAMVSLSARF